VTHPSKSVPVAGIKVPRELAGKWVAFTNDNDGARIVASADTLRDCRIAAAKVGEATPRFKKAPPAHVRLVGFRR
jgi:hypothetical protein